MQERGFSREPKGLLFTLQTSTSAAPLCLRHLAKLLRPNSSVIQSSSERLENARKIYCKP